VVVFFALAFAIATCVQSSPDVYFLPNNLIDGPVYEMGFSPFRDNGLCTAGCWPAYAHDDYIREVAFSRDGNVLASASDDNTVKIWDSKTGKLKMTLEWLTDSAYTCSFHPNNKWIAAGDYDSRFAIWDYTTGELLQHWFQHETARIIYKVRFSPDGNLLAVSNSDYGVEIYQLDPSNSTNMYTKIQDWFEWGMDVRGMEFSRDGRWLAVGFSAGSSTTGGVSVYDTWSWARVQHFYIYDDEDVYSLGFSPDGNYLAVGTGYGNVEIYDTREWDSQNNRWKFSVFLNVGYSSYEINSLSYSPNGHYLLAVDDDGYIYIWSTKDWKMVFFEDYCWPEDICYGDALSAAWSPDSRYFALGDDSYYLRMLDASELLPTPHTECISDDKKYPSLGVGGWIYNSRENRCHFRCPDMSPNNMTYTLFGRRHCVETDPAPSACSTLLS